MSGFKTFYNTHNLQRRFLAIVLIVIMLFTILLGRVFYLQIINGKNLQSLAADEWLRDLPLSSRRGEIYDANGVSLATTITTYDVYVRARNVTNALDLATELSKKLNVDYNSAYNKVTNKNLRSVNKNAS